MKSAKLTPWKLPSELSKRRVRVEYARQRRKKKSSEALSVAMIEVPELDLMVA